MLISNPNPHLTCHIITPTSISRFSLNSQQISLQFKRTVKKVDSYPDEEIIHHNYIIGSNVVHFENSSNKTKPVSSTLRTVVVKLALISNAFRRIATDFFRKFYK